MVSLSKHRIPRLPGARHSCRFNSMRVHMCHARHLPTKYYAGRCGKMREEPVNSTAYPGKTGRDPGKTDRFPAKSTARNRLFPPFGERDRPGPAVGVSPTAFLVVSILNSGFWVLYSISLFFRFLGSLLAFCALRANRTSTVATGNGLRPPTPDTIAHVRRKSSPTSS